MSNLQVYNIATINVKTQGQNFKRKNLFTGKRNVKILAEFIRENELHSVGTQELTYMHQNALAQELGKGYLVSGGYRFGNGPVLERIPFNESNAIVTHIEDVDYVSNKTIHLPSWPTGSDVVLNGVNTLTKLQPRILTYVIDDEKQLVHINTHLHDSFPEKREEQELFIADYAKALKIAYPEYDMIVTGDFNDDITKLSFQKFVDEMKKLGLERIPILQKTYSKQQKNIAIDHIFISKGLSLEDFKVCDTGDITTTTDHYPVIANISKNR